MAKNNVGVWPKNTIAGYMAEHQECSSNAQRAFDILGQRVDNLVYDEGVCTFKGDPYVIDAIFGSPDTTGIEIATAIKVLNPVVKPAESDGWVKLSCYDVINPFQIPTIRQVNTGWDLMDDEGYDLSFKFEDERFLTVIVKKPDELQLYFWKK